MALRIREDGTILCAALHDEMLGDTYLHDGISYILTVELKAIVTEVWEKHKIHGQWWWANDIPEWVKIEDASNDFSSNRTWSY